MLFNELVDLLKNTSSTNGKIDILKNISNNHKLLLQLIYDPFRMFNINTIESNSSGNKNIDDNVGELVIICKHLNEKDIPIANTKIMLNNYYNNLTKNDQDILLKILNKDLKVGIGIKLLNKALGKGFIREFNIQLANKYQDFIKKKNYKTTKYFYCSPKLDGHRLFYMNGKLFSRSGKEYVGFEHIIEELKVIENSYNNIFIDGELYSDKLDFNSIASKINSSVNFSEEEKKELKYYVFAIGSLDENNKEYNETINMIETLKNIQNNNRFNYIKFIKYELIDNNIDKIHSKCLGYMEQGYEGIMLRDVNNSYDFKRSDNLLKYKIFEENDFIIKELLEGTKGTDRENNLGSISCYGTVDYNRNNVEVVFNANFKGTDEERTNLWNIKDELKGKLVEVKYQGISQDKSGNYSLRFPVATKIKIDRS